MTENVYDKAREVLRERGWTQGTIGGGRGNVTEVCVLGALSLAAKPNLPALYETARPLAGPVAAAIREQFPESIIPESLDCFVVQCFNDGDKRTVEDVDLVLDKAARAWDEQHATGGVL